MHRSPSYTSSLFSNRSLTGIQTVENKSNQIELNRFIAKTDHVATP